MRSDHPSLAKWYKEAVHSFSNKAVITKDSGALSIIFLVVLLIFFGELNWEHVWWITER